MKIKLVCEYCNSYIITNQIKYLEMFKNFHQGGVCHEITRC